MLVDHPDGREILAEIMRQENFRHTSRMLSLRFYGEEIPRQGDPRRAHINRKSKDARTWIEKTRRGKWTRRKLGPYDGFEWEFVQDGESH